MDDFLVRAAVAGAGLAAVMAPVGSFVVWRRMAYFGDTLAHASLLGIALGLLLGFDPTLGVIAVCVAVAVVLTLLRRQQRLSSDTLLGILSHSALSFGLVAIAFLETVRVDLITYLFGDILAVTGADLLWIYGGGAAGLIALAVIWRPLLRITIHEDLARVEGVPVVAVQVAFMVLIATVIALAMKVVGILLVTALLIIPAATARHVARSPEQMAAGGALVGVVAVGLGLAASLYWNLPSGPAIVVALALLFALATGAALMGGRGRPA
ncbi:MAG: hypothetical protein EXQ96_00620 [Alphaproteobacteria bacterium]|nr:hypothetical protein [Alphaproteobacteria bacterium]